MAADLVIMTLMQLLLAYGALDAARLLHTQGQFEAYMPPLDNSFFYVCAVTPIAQATAVYLRARHAFLNVDATCAWRHSRIRSWERAPSR